MTGFKVTSFTTYAVTEDTDILENERLVSIYDGSGILTADITYEFQEISEGPITLQNIELVSYNSPVDGLSVFQKDLNTLCIQGTALNVIQGGNYKFLMSDNTIKILPADTPEKYDALIGWAPPPIKMVQVSHVLNIKIKDILLDDRIETFSITQEIYWKYAIGLQQFQLALAKGKL